MKKRLILNINDEMKQVFLKVGTGNWLDENIPKYNPELVPDNPKYSKKSLFRPKISLETFRALQEIPGESNTQRVVNLYYNIEKQNKKKENRKKILRTLSKSPLFEKVNKMKEYIKKVFEERNVKIKDDAIDLVNERIEKYIYDLADEAMSCAKIRNSKEPSANDIELILKFRKITKINKT